MTSYLNLMPSTEWLGVGGDGFEGVGGGGQGVVDVGGGVDGGDEGGFELRWGEEDAAVEHFAEEAGVALCIAALGAGVVADGLVAKEKSGERAGIVDLAGEFGVGESFAEAFGEAITLFGNPMVKTFDAELFQCGNARGHRERIPCQRACLIDGAER